jgi:hypothetical protein
MPSSSLKTWTTSRSTELDEIKSAHRSVGGPRRGRRYATQQINHAYAMLLSSQFQGFCRDLHSECADHLVQLIGASGLRVVLRKVIILNRELDKGNPIPEKIGSDFGRFGLAFWDEVMKCDARNLSRRNRLTDLNKWRNAIAHQNFDPGKLGGTKLRFQQVQDWRAACNQLASSFDEVMRVHILDFVGSSPW